MAPPPGTDEENFADEPAEDGRRQHKYSTANMKRDPFPWKRCLLICLIFLLVIAVMVIITLLFQKLFDPPEDEDWDDSSDNATLLDDDLVQEDSLLPKSMQYIEQACAEDRLGDPNDSRECEEVCKDANECCDPFATNSSCFSEHVSGCFIYGKCHTLNKVKDPAHNDLDRICAKSALEINRDECEVACSNLACCFSDTDSCLSTNFQACMDYAACHNLKEIDTIDVAKTDLAERCATKSPTCERDCKEALCCSDVSSSCYRDNFMACLSYASCTGKSDTKVWVAPIYSRLDPAPEDFDNTCGRSYIEKNGATECLIACQPAMCCWKSGSNGCFGDDPLGCLEYQNCKILEEPQYKDETLPPNYTPAPAPGSSSGGAGAGGEEEEEETPATAPPSAASTEIDVGSGATVSRGTSSPTGASAGNSTAEGGEEQEPTNSPTVATSEAATTVKPTVEEAGDSTAGQV